MESVRPLIQLQQMEFAHVLNQSVRDIVRAGKRYYVVEDIIHEHIRLCTVGDTL